MPFYGTPGGSIIEMDLPAAKNAHAVQRHAEAVERGDLVEISAERVESYQDGPGIKLRLIAPVEPVPVSAPKGKGNPKE